MQSIRQRLREVEMEAMDTHSALLDLRVEVAHCEGKKRKVSTSILKGRSPSPRAVELTLKDNQSLIPHPSTDLHYSS